MQPDILIITVIAGAIAWLWLDSLRVREAALRHCFLACERIGVQFLDQTVALKRIRLTRNGRGRVIIERQFGFEFSAKGEDRHSGVAVMQGNRLYSMYLEAFDERNDDETG